MSTSEDILDRLIPHAEQAEVVNVWSESATVRFEANRLKSSQVKEVRGTAVRVVRDGRLGFAASGDESATDKLLRNALESAAYGDRLPISFPAPQPAPQVRTFDPTIANLPVSRLVEIGQEILDLILQAEPTVQVNVELERGIEEIEISNHTGTRVNIRRSPLSIQVDLARIRDDDVLIIYHMSGTTVWDADYLTLARRLGKKLTRARRSARIKSGRMPVILAPHAALVLAMPLMLGLNGKNVYTGISPMRDKIGQKLFADQVTIVDDPTLDGRFGSAPYDDEGVPHRRNTMVEAGVLKGFLYDLKTAAQSGTESTGNGGRSLFAPPSPSPTNLTFASGDVPLTRMIAGVKEGLLIEDVLGLGQGNIISGAFSNPVSLAFKIENGEVAGRVKDVSIAGNAYDLLQEVEAISQEREWVYRRFSLPYMLLKDMNVVAKG